MMRLGYPLLVAGFLAGAYATALDIEATNWTLFVPAAMTALVGLVLIRLAARGEARSETLLSNNQAELREALDRIVANIDAISAERADIGTDALRGEIDRRLRDDLRRFAEVRDSMVHLFGVQTYADIMSEFAAGERNVNRVWSASTDGYGDEADACLLRAAGRFKAARDQLTAAVNRN